MPIVLKSENLKLLELSGPDQACNGRALPLPYTKSDRIMHEENHPSCYVIYIYIYIVYCAIFLCVSLLLHVYLLYCVCIAIFILDVGLQVRSQYSEGLATGHLDTGFSRFPCA